MEKEPKLNQEARVEQKINPELVKELEKSNLEVDDKTNLLLTKAGLKPASELLLVIKTWDKKETRQHMTEGEVQKNLQLIRKMGLPTIERDREVVRWGESKTKYGKERVYKREQMTVLVARTQDDLEFLKRALQSKNDELLGRAFGFPTTAIEAWLGGRKKLNIAKLSKRMRESEAFLFSSPTLSEDNWQEEIKQGQQWADFIKEKSPVIYKQMMKVMKTRYE